MRADQTPTIRLKDYSAPDWYIESVHLDITLDDNWTRVIARTVFASVSNVIKPLILDGDELVLDSVALDDTLLSQNDFKIDASTLTITSPPAHRFTLTVTTRLDPAANTKLMGLIAHLEITARSVKPKAFVVSRISLIVRISCPFIQRASQPKSQKRQFCWVMEIRLKTVI